MKDPQTPFKNLERQFKAMMSRLPGEVSVIAQGHFIQNFQRQGYIDQAGRTVQWKKRSFERPGKQRAILIQSGSLRRSVRPRPGLMTARVVADANHARLHNRGGEIEITPKMRRYFWAMHAKVKGAYTEGRVNREAEFWKRMALAKGPIRIPARPFMVSNPVLMDQIRKHTFNSIERIFKQS